MATMAHLPLPVSVFSARRALAVLLMGLFAFLPPAAADQLPSLGSQSGGALTAAQEREIGQKFLSRAQRQLTFVQDPEVREVQVRGPASVRQGLARQSTGEEESGGLGDGEDGAPGRGHGAIARG